MPKRKNCPYETLGVSKDAKPEELKRVYRHKAKAAHPDKGGSQQEMTELASAYRVLSDPVKRARYDSTGEDESINTVEERIRNILIYEFTNALNEAMQDQLSERSILKIVRSTLNKNLKDMRKAVVDIDAAGNRLKKKRDKVTCKVGDNWVHVIIDQNLAVYEANKQDIEGKIEVATGALAKLDEYEEQIDAPVRASISWATSITSGTFG